MSSKQEENRRRILGAVMENSTFDSRAALKAKCSAWFVQQTMKRAGFRVFKIRKAPNRRDQQNKAAKSRARKLYREWLMKPMCVVMDDETYIKADTKQIPRLKFYVAKSQFDVPEDIRKKKVEKIARKILALANAVN